MAGTKRGGRLAAMENKRKYGEDFYRKIGAAGGKAGKTGGFYANRELARVAGAKGGRISRKKPGTSRTAIYRRKALDYEGTPDHPDVTGGNM